MGDLSSQLVYAFLVSIVDAAVVSWVVLLWYRRAVGKLMRQGASRSTPQVVVVPEASDMVSPINVALFDTDSSTPTLVERGDAPQWPRLALAYGLGGVLHAAVIATALFGSDTFLVWFSQVWVYAWPLVPTLSVLLVMERSDSVKLAVAYTLAGCVAVALVTLARQALRGSFDSAPLTNVFWFVLGLAVTLTVGSLALFASALRAIRAMTPVALVAMLLFGLSLSFYHVVFSAAFNVESIRDVMLALPAPERLLYYGPFMVLALPIGWAAWRLVRLLAVAYERKRFSDTQMIIDCWWLIVTAEEIAFTLTNEHGYAGVAIGLAAFAAYRTCVTLVLWRRAGPAVERPKRLLLLRVFGYRKRTETLFDRVAQKWRFTGPVQLIAGADLAMRTADPGDMLAFVSGRLGDRYVASADEIARRVDDLDVGPDPDGRFRVNEVYCRDDTWRATFQALLATSDTVLMDLRSFCTANAGCAFEIEQLMARVPAERIVFVYDGTTDLALLSRFIDDAWRRAGHVESPRGPIACVRVDRNSWRELRLLMQQLRGIAKPQRVLTLADLATA